MGPNLFSPYRLRKETTMAPNTTGRPSDAPEFRPWLKYYDPQVPPHLTYPRIPLYSLLDETSAKYPISPCTNFFGKQLTYRQIKQLSDRFAAGIHRMGIRKGDRVVLLLPNSPQFIIAYYGLLKAGAVVVPLNPLSAERELEFYLTDSEAGVAITIPLFLSKVASLKGKTPLKHIVCSRLSDFLPFPLSLVQGFREQRLVRGGRDAAPVDFKELLKQEVRPDWSPEPVQPEEMAVLIYSGGTTGIAKGIMLSHFNFVANAHQIIAWGSLTNEQGLLAVLPLFHGFGMSVTMNSAILAGGEITLLPRFNAKQVAKTIQKRKPSFFIGVPTMFVQLSNLPDIHRYDFSSLRGIFVGAAPLTKAIKDDFEKKTGGRMIEGYGLTEAVTAIMANPYKGTHKLASIGIPFSDVDMKIVSLDDGRTLPPGELGEIALRSPDGDAWLLQESRRNPEDDRGRLAPHGRHRLRGRRTVTFTLPTGRRSSSSSAGSTSFRGRSTSSSTNTLRSRRASLSVSLIRAKENASRSMSSSRQGKRRPRKNSSPTSRSGSRRTKSRPRSSSARNCPKA